MLIIRPYTPAGHSLSARKHEARWRGVPHVTSATHGAQQNAKGGHASALGAFGANYHLRQSLVCHNVPAMQQPEAYIGGAEKLFDASGKLVNESPRKFLQDDMQAYAAGVALHVKL